MESVQGILKGMRFLPNPNHSMNPCWEQQCWACSITCVWACLTSLCSFFQPPQFKLDPRLARLLGIHTQTRPVIIQALWQYIKTHKLQDPHEREFVICDKYLQQVSKGRAATAASVSLLGSWGWLNPTPADLSALSLSQIFESQRMKFSEIPQRLHALLMPPEPIIINHVIR